MYVCVCNAITERQVRNSVASGSVTLADLQFDLGVATCCGSCAETACQYLPTGASGCEHAYEAAMDQGGHPAAVEAGVSGASTRRFPVHVIAKAA
ncbi:MAG: (2Fe-2S)-binding protein [Pigmentiphaga sp.]|uniref:(2Fe-2S)-binding protein n=1 Tax=Pigmentiphaga sp. TaxID=1977564 RepID=UPI0029B72ECF|nr:(2Fe-2S)-binding protein [Pigmentiphaga sp.]MDX3906040.1 (2Fe-2S)-binding protein [Pigmentiphaga sp.]